MHLSDEARESGHSVFRAHRQGSTVRLIAYEGGTGELLYDYPFPAEFADFISDGCQAALEEWDARRRRALMRRA